MDSCRYFISLVIFIFTVRSTFCCNGFEKNDFNSSIVSPKMKVHSVPGKVKIIESTTTVLVEGVGVEIRIDCWAPFPIDFEFYGHLSNREATVNLIKRVAPKYTDPSTFCFHINVTVRSYEEMTGEYICMPVQNRSLNTSYYIYSAVHPPETLLNRGQNIKVEAQPNDEWVTIPCAVSNPNITVKLYNDQNHMIPLNDDVKFNSKIGFTLKINEKLWGKFQCRTGLHENDMVEIQIYPPKKFLVVPSDKLVSLKEGDVLKVSCESMEDIIIKYDKNNLPMSQVKGKPLYEGRKLEFFLEFESRILKAGDSGILTCETKKENRILHQWIFQVKEVKNSMLVRNEGLNSNLCDGPNPMLTLFECNNWIECKMRKCLRKDRTCESNECKDSQTFNCLPSGILQCYNKQNESVQDVIYFSGIGRNNSYTNWSTAPKEDILKIDGSINTFSTLTSVKVVCEGSSFVFAVGFKWFVLTKHGIQLEISDDNIEHKWRNIKSKNIIKSTARINISNQVKTIICKAPVWNTTEWKDDILDLTGLYTSTNHSRHDGTSSLTNSIYPHRTELSIFVLFLVLYRSI